MQTLPTFECDSTSNDLFLVVDQGRRADGLEDFEDLLQHVPMQPGLERNPGLEIIDWLLDVPESTSPSSSLHQAQHSSRQQQGHSSRAVKQGRKCTSLAQREAHKRYRVKKKQNVSTSWHSKQSAFQRGHSQPDICAGVVSKVQQHLSQLM